MVATLVGFEKVEFTDYNNNSVKGIRLYITYESDFVTGVGADLKYFPDNGTVKLPDQLRVGAKYEFVYQQSGFSGKNRLVAVKPV